MQREILIPKNNRHADQVERRRERVGGNEQKTYKYVIFFSLNVCLL